MAKTSWRRDYTRDIIDLKNRYDDIKEHIGEPPDGQVPLGDTGIYTSPNLQNGKAVDPRDCTYYPDSPFCGGNPWTKTPVGLEPDWGIDKCGAWVQFTPVLLFTKLPPVSVGWRRPGECREEEEPPAPPPVKGDDGRQVSPLEFPNSIDPNVKVFAVVARVYFYQYSYHSGWYWQGTWYQNGDPTSSKLLINQSLADRSYPSLEIFPSYYPYPPTYDSIPLGVIGSAAIQSKSVYSVTGQEDVSNFYIDKNWISVDQRPAWRSNPNYKRYLPRDGELVGNYLISGIAQRTITEVASFCLYGTLAEIKRDWQYWVTDFASVEKRDTGDVATYFVQRAEWRLVYISVPDARKYPPPPDQKRKKDCCMQCCNGGNQAANKQNQDNAEILRLLRKIDKNIGVFPLKSELFDADDNKPGIQRKSVTSQNVAEAVNLAIKELQRTLKAIGIDILPIYGPSSLIQDESHGLLGDLGDLKNKLFKQKIESLAEFLVWRAKNDNEIFGQWQEVIEIQDSDPNVKGNQPKRVVLPNMAKTLREIILLLSVLIKSQGFSMDALLKMYIDVANTKVSASVSEAILRDIQDYLDYPTVTKPLDVPMGISIPKDNDPTDDKEDVERFLKNSIIKAMFDDWTGEGSLHDMMLTLLDAASKSIQKPHT